MIESSSRPMGMVNGRRSLLRAGAIWAIALTIGLAPPVRAQQGINLSWDDCGPAGSSAKTFACDTNLGSELIFGSFEVLSPVVLLGYNPVLDLQTSGDVLPDWWQFKNAGSCRQAALVASIDFGTWPPGCLDVWGGAAFSGLASYDVGLGGPNRARMVLGVANATGDITGFPGGVEIAAFKLLLSHDKTEGTGACLGCGQGACIVFNSLTLTLAADLSLHNLTTPLNRNFVTWQTGFPNCPGATPAQKTTWGAIKTLYR